MRRLIGFAACVGAVLLIYHQTPDTSGWDAALLLYTAAGLLLLVALMAIYTRHWTTLGVGLVGIFVGAALLRGASSLLYWDRDLLSRAQVAWLADLVRALLAVGTTYAVVAAIAYIRAGREPVDPDRLIDGPDTS